MKTFNQMRETLAEAKVSMTKLKAGMTLNVVHAGRSASNYGVRDQDVYGGKVKVLGIGIKPYKDKPNKRQVLATDLKSFKSKYSSVFKSEEIMYGQFFTALDRLKEAVDMIVDQEKGIKGPASLIWMWQVTEGENKGVLGFCYISNEPKWEVTFLNKSTEFKLES